MKTHATIAAGFIVILAIIAGSLAQPGVNRSLVRSLAEEEQLAKAATMMPAMPWDAAMQPLSDPNAIARERGIAYAIHMPAEEKEDRQLLKEDKTLAEEEIAKYAILHPAEYEAQLSKYADAQMRQASQRAILAFLEPEMYHQNYGSKKDAEWIRQQEAAFRSALKP